MNKKQGKYKVVLLGDTSVGKSCLASRFVNDTFFTFQEPTIGAAFMKRGLSPFLEHVEEGLEIHQLQVRQVLLHRLLLQPVANIGLKEMLPDPKHVVEDEEAIGLLEKQQLLFVEPVHLVIGPQELHEAFVEQRVDSVAKGRLIALGSHHARAEIQVEHARLDTEPVVVPAGEKLEARVVHPD